MFICCSVTRSAEACSSEGLDCQHVALSIRGKGKVQISDNVIKLCDIGIQALDQSTPIIRSNIMDNMLLCCLLVEGSGTKPSIVNNVLSGGSQESQTGAAGGVGLLCLDEAGGLVGKNIFQVLSRCYSIVTKKYICLGLGSVPTF
ncbi:uncharacterized protein LOC111717666 [Eurytemora carolleeae]|uniref:uncharacterized protein LOC111717666 n=1 Tax=Eurytemora carolleeae TaxID=1294199 RepID=UPI000C7814DE|nr:uncharacterized protein LOC111717666 [Eurytemora carolleeae]|eukprot:XP_023348926.1 uncharacterized protein LOC111717666 [Eurytemora affinis]